MNNTSCNFNVTLNASAPSRYIAIALYSIVICIGFIGNLLLCIVLVKKRKLRYSSDVYFLHASMADLVSTVMLPLWLHYVLNFAQLSREACISFSVTFYVPLFVQAWLLISIAMERYSNLVWMAPISVKTAFKHCIGTWIVSAFVASPYYAYRNSHDEHECILGNYTWHINEPLHTCMDVVIIVWTFLAPVLVTIIASVKMRRTTWGNPRLNEKNSDILVVLVVMTVFFWGPFNIMLVIDNILQRYYDNTMNCDVEKVKHIMAMISEAIVYFRGITAPIIYVGISGRFREEIYSLFRRQPYSDLDPDANQFMIELTSQGRSRNRNARQSESNVPQPEECFW
ncbi:Cy218 [Cynomolgus cytomegalovirus]|uniref:Protein US28d n=1 Tax=Cynomolgus macaque cytomegalovirus strain Mauritius TaxID=1690255 RepID=A0A0K1GZQ5_9BETA|nr:Cy218 [Cynomolgus cytomegalovirus]AKT72698.1 protein US28d [Cynomolgus macaque cytomegalovirus strain Mauritius]AXG21952.1 protein US28d [synthetic construct]APT39275.1 Cy218 [Cynomolgus cytomegalovirus]APT39562.1 Cy218 [Cynomolgus cytomegalovirus]APT39659.1 Cy218 [Cynomolgus cytomegalovirus]